MLNEIDEMFLTIVDCGSLSKAAEIMYMTQPSLTKKIKSLEKKLGVELFEHNTKPLRLNAAGEIYRDYLLSSIDGQAKLVKALAEAKEGKRGVLRIGTPATLGSCLLPIILPPFIRKYPGVSLTTKEATGAELQTSIVSDELDIAFSYTHITESTVDFMTLSRDQVFFVMKNTVKNVVGKSAQPIFLELENRLLSETKLCLYNKNQFISELVDNYFMKYQIERNVFLHCSSPSTNVQLIQQIDNCGTFLPSYYIKMMSDEMKSSLVFYYPSTDDLKWDFRVLFSKRRALSPYAKELIAITRELW